MTRPHPVPRDRAALAPYLTVKNAAKAIEFYAAALGAQERFRLVGPSGGIGHAELSIGACVVMISDEAPDFGALSPQTLGGSPIKLHLYVEDADAAVARAVAAGAVVSRTVKDEFYGDRVGLIVDPFGYSWHIASRIEDVGAEEMQRRWSDAMTGATSG